MAKQTQFHVLVDGGTITMVFPAVTPLAIGAANPAVASGASTVVAAANAARRYVEVVNPTGSVIWLNYGGAAAALNIGIPIQPGQSWFESVENNQQACIAELQVWQNSGAGVAVPVLIGV